MGKEVVPDLKVVTTQQQNCTTKSHQTMSKYHPMKMEILRETILQKFPLITDVSQMHVCTWTT